MTTPGLYTVCTCQDGFAVCSYRTLGMYGVNAYSASGAALWSYLNQPAANTAPPILSYGSSASISTDGSRLVGLDAFGSPLGPTIDIVPPLGPTWPTVATHNGVVMLSACCGGIAGYLTDGVPHASTVLQGKGPQGQDGIYTPLGAPLVMQNRLVYLTAFRADGVCGESQGQQGRQGLGSMTGAVQADAGACRIYAVDVARTLNNRLRVAWTRNVSCPAQTSQAAATSSPPGALAIATPGGLMCFGVGEPVTMLCLRDAGNTSTVVPQDALPGAVAAVAAPALAGEAEEQSGASAADGPWVDSELLVVHLEALDNSTSRLAVVNASSGRVVSTADVQKALGSEIRLQRTAFMSVMATNGSASGWMSEGASSAAYLLTAARNRTTGASLMVAWQLPTEPVHSSIEPLWTLPLPPPAENASVVGQALILQASGGPGVTSLLVPTSVGPAFFTWPGRRL